MKTFFETDFNASDMLSTSNMEDSKQISDKKNF